MASDIAPGVPGHASHGAAPPDNDPDLIKSARQFLLVHKFLPSPENVATRAKIFTDFSKILLGDQLQRVKIGQGGMPDGYKSVFEDGHLLIVQVGSHGLGIWHPSDPMSCLCLGSVSQSTFYSAAERKLRSAEENAQLRILDKFWDPETESGAAFHVDMRGVLIKLQYCCLGVYEMSRYVSIVCCNLPSLSNEFRWESLLVHPPQQVTLPSEVLVNLNTCRDIRYICDTIPNLEKFRIVYRILELWSRCRGIYSGPLGYLDRDILVFLLNHFWKVRPVNDASVLSAVREFFAYYSIFNWEKETIVDPTDFYAKHSAQYGMRKDIPAEITTIFPPAKNLASLISKNTLQILRREFTRARDLTSTASISWQDLMGLSGETDSCNPFSTAMAEFMRTFNIFVRFDMRYWGLSPTSRARFFYYMGREYASLFTRLSELDLRVYLRSYDCLLFAWPYRLTETATNVEDDKLFYLIGIGYNVAVNSRQSFFERLKLECEKFAHKVSEGSIFDPTTAWIQISVIEKRHIGEIALDREVGISEVLTTMPPSCYDGNSSFAREILPSNHQLIHQLVQREGEKTDTKRKEKKPAHSKLRPAVGRILLTILQQEWHIDTDI